MALSLSLVPASFATATGPTASPPPGVAFEGSQGSTGAIDTRAWRLVSDLSAGEPPRLAPVEPTAATAVGPWSALGSNGAGNGALNSSFPQVYALAVSGSNLYVGGNFENAAGIPEADRIARWNGSAWSALGSNGAGDGAIGGLSGLYSVRALAVSGGDLYVGGRFNDAAGIPEADNLVKWNGSSWSALGSNGAGDGAIPGCPGSCRVDALAVIGTNLYAGGNFGNVAGLDAADYIARWNGASWSALGSGSGGNGALSSPVLALAPSGTDLYVGGAFDGNDTHFIAEADYVAKWNGTTWSALGSDGSGDGALNGDVHALAISNGTLYAGGQFYNAAGIATADHLAKWNGSTWSAVGPTALGTDSFSNGLVRDILVDGANVYVAYQFDNAFGIPEADRIARWNGSAWSALGSNGAGNGALNSTAWALALLGGQLYVGGEFNNAAGIPTADYIAAWGTVPFTDIWGTTFEKDIIWVYNEGITSGCSPTLYCPTSPVTRGQMASFLARALGLPPTGTDYFDDDDGTTHEQNINRVAAAGITSGCGPGTYCPNANVSRGQMASFLARALGLTAGANINYFSDDNGTTHEQNINRLRHAGLTTGCTPTTYCPNANVTRGQMAAFLHRAFD